MNMHSADYVAHEVGDPVEFGKGLDREADSGLDQRADSDAEGAAHWFDRFTIATKLQAVVLSSTLVLAVLAASILGSMAYYSDSGQSLRVWSYTNGHGANAAFKLAEADMQPAHVVRMNIYTTDVALFMEKAGDIIPIFAADAVQPVCTLLGISALYDPDLMVEIEATAVA